MAHDTDVRDPDSTDTEPGTRRWTREFFPGLWAITATGLAVRLAYVLFVRRDHAPAGDSFFYHAAANLLVDGKGFIAPLPYALGATVEAADHPPLYTVFLSIPSALGLDTPLTHMLWSAILGSATVIVAGLVGRRIAGDRAGLLAALLVAIYPNVWVWDGALLSETLAILFATTAVLLAYATWDRPGTGRAVALGAVCGLAALSRSELILLVPALLAPVVLLAPGVDCAARLRRLGAGTAATLVVLAPWVGYNLTRFEHPVLLSSQFESTLAGANCRDTYEGPAIGFLTLTCVRNFDVTDDQSVNARLFRERSTRFIRDHLDRVPVVVAVRVGRVVGVYRPAQQIEYDEFEGREHWLAVTASIAYYLIAIGAIVGVVVVRRRRSGPLFPLLVLPAIVLVTVAVTYGTTRFRASAETSLAILAAVAVAAGWARIRQTGSADTYEGADRGR